MLKAPEVDDLIERLNRYILNPVGYSKKVKEKIEELYELLDKIKPISDDEYRVLYFSADKGSIDNFSYYIYEKDESQVTLNNEHNDYIFSKNIDRNTSIWYL